MHQRNRYGEGSTNTRMNLRNHLVMMVVFERALNLVLSHLSSHLFVISYIFSYVLFSIPVDIHNAMMIDVNLQRAESARNGTVRKVLILLVAMK